MAFFSKLGTDMSDAAMAGWGQMADDIKSVWETIKASVGEWVTYFRDLGGRMATALKDGINSLLPDWAQIGSDMAAGMLGGYTDGMRGASGAWAAASQIPANEARKVNGIKSPSRVFAEIGRQLMQGLGLGIEQGTGAVAKTLSLIHI